MGVGRFVCVGLPLVLTIGAIISLLVAALSGVTHNSLYIFRVNASGLSVNPGSVVGNLGSNLGDKLGGDLGGVLDNVKLNGRADLTIGNITGATVGIADFYDVTLWGFCATARDGQRECSKPQFDWASKELNTSWLDSVGAIAGAAGVKVTVPEEVKSGLKAFSALAKWTEVAFIIALVTLGIELVVGVFATCSRAVSCLTWCTASVAAIFVGIAAGLATAMATVVIGTLEAAAEPYGVRGSIGSRFLAAAWIAFAFALAAAFFWLFTMCCCKPEHRSRGGMRARNADRNSSDGEKLMPSRGYAPLGNETQMSGAYGHANQQSNRAHYPGGAGRTDMAYEPYSHRV